VDFREQSHPTGHFGVKHFSTPKFKTDVRLYRIVDLSKEKVILRKLRVY